MARKPTGMLPGASLPPSDAVSRTWVFVDCYGGPVIPRAVRTPTARRRPSRWAVALVVAAAVAAPAGCAEDRGPSTAEPAPSGRADGASTTGDLVPAAGSTPTTAPGATEAAPPEQYDGSDDDFYVVPDPLPPGEAGELIRVQDLGESDGYVHLRVMYHSRDARDRDRAVTGIISHPTAEAPPDGWPVIALAHGTTGLGSACAPSRLQTTAPGFGLDGVRVATDYVGLGPVGEVHPYLSGLSEAQPVLDIIRAARHLPEADAGPRWVAVGHSQGGHAALFTHEIAEDYAPELEHLGTVVSAPAAVLDRRFGPDDEVVPRMVALMALYGMAQDHPELDPDDYAGEQLRARSEIVTTGCTQDVIDNFVAIPPDELYETDPMDDPTAREIVLGNDPGQVATDVPMLLLYGELDWWVVPDRVRYLFGRLCDVGQQTELVSVPTGDHGNLLDEAAPTVTDWLRDRLAGEPATDSCQEA